MKRNVHPPPAASPPEGGEHFILTRPPFPSSSHQRRGIAGSAEHHGSVCRALPEFPDSPNTPQEHRKNPADQAHPRRGHEEAPAFPASPATTDKAREAARRPTEMKRKKEDPRKPSYELSGVFLFKARACRNVVFIPLPPSGCSPCLRGRVCGTERFG